MKKYRKILFILIIGLFFISNRNESKAQWIIMSDEADSIVRKGMNFMYNVQFDSASLYFREVTKLYPRNPVGYFLDGMVEWWRLTIYQEYYKDHSKFINKMQKVIDLCDNLLDSDKTDVVADFFKGGALGYLGRYYSDQKEWLKAGQNGKAGYDMLVECLKIAPGNHDIMLGTGIFNYMVEAIPEKYPLIQPLLFFLPKGDKKIGLMQLQASAQYASYANIEAKVILLQIYFTFEKNYSEALKIAEDLHSHYPLNPYFYRYLGRCYVANGSLTKWDAAWRDMLIRCMNKNTGYDYKVTREALYYIGMALTQQNQLEMALKYFYKADEACRFLDKEGPSDFMCHTNLYIGKIYDMQGKRNLAIMQYKKVLSWKDYQNVHEEANSYMKQPYKR